jgi:hypothetical protein
MYTWTSKANVNQLIYALSIDFNYSCHSYMMNFSIEKNQHFRLMDLPTELRLMIAEYVLTEEKGLWWIWTVFSPTRKVGGFTTYSSHKLYSNNLAQVSRQLHDECHDVLLSCNTLVFRGRCPYMLINCIHKMLEENIKGWQHFRGSISPKTLPKIKNVIFDICVSCSEQIKHETQFLKFNEIANVDPSISFHPRDPFVGSSLQSGQLFHLTRGYLEDILSKPPFNTAQRRWKVILGDESSPPFHIWRGDYPQSDIAAEVR